VIELACFSTMYTILSLEKDTSYKGRSQFDAIDDLGPPFSVVSRPSRTYITLNAGNLIHGEPSLRTVTNILR